MQKIQQLQLADTHWTGRQSKSRQKKYYKNKKYYLIILPLQLCNEQREEEKVTLALGGKWWEYSCPWICQAFKEDPWAGYLQGDNVNSQRESWTGSLSWERSRASLNATSHETQSQRPEHNLIRPERVISCLFWGCSHYTLPWEKEDAVYSSRPTGSAKFIFPYKWRPVLLTFFQLRLDLFIFTHLQEMGTFQSIILSPGKQFVLLNHGQRQISHSLHMLPQRFI